MLFLSLQVSKDYRIRINFDLVLTYYAIDTNKTVVTMLSGIELRVIESPEEITNLLKASLKIKNGRL